MTVPTDMLKFHHVGIGVLDLEAAINVYEGLGHRLELKIDDPGLNIRIAFLEPPGGGAWIELLAPLEANGPLKSLIARKILPAPYHTCYGTDDLEVTTGKLRALGFLGIGKAHPALAFGGHRVAFFYQPDIGLIEVVERPPEWPVQPGANSV